MFVSLTIHVSVTSAYSKFVALLWHSQPTDLPQPELQLPPCCQETGVKRSSCNELETVCLPSLDPYLPLLFLLIDPSLHPSKLGRHTAGIVPSRHRPCVIETPTCPLRSSGTVPLHSQLQWERLIFLNVSVTASSTDEPGGNVTELIAREVVGDGLIYIYTVQKGEQYPHLRFLLLKWCVMQTKWAELFCPLREVTHFFTLFSLIPPSLLLLLTLSLSSLSICGSVIDGTSELLSSPKQLASRRSAHAQTATSLLPLLLLYSH